MKYDRLFITGLCAEPILGAGAGPGVPTVGSAAELATWLSDTVWKVSHPYVSGSSQVWVNGAKVQAGTDKAYVESPTDGTVTFNTAHSASDVVYVSYVAMLPSPITLPVGGYYISPTGNDSTGDGSVANPWLTIDKFGTVAVPGATLYCRGGTYSGTTRTILLGPSTASGTVGAPITVRNYPGENPHFEGPGSGSFEQFLMFSDGIAYWTVDGLQIDGFKVGSSGAIYVGRNVGLLVSTHHIVIRNCRIEIVHEGGGPFNHPVYLSAYANNCTVEYNHLIGAQVGGSDGVGVNVGDHEPSPQGTLIHHNIFENFGNAGAIWFNGDLNTGSILHNTFLNPAVIYISLRNYVSVTVRDNAGETASSHNISDVNDSGHGVSTIDHNFFGQTFDSDFYLVPGSTGIGAASDGADAGARSR